MGDEVAAVLILLQTRESHFCTGDVLLGVFEVFEQGILSPYDALVHVSGGVGETFNLTGLASEETVKVRSDFVRSTFFEGMALSTSRFE